MKKFFISNLNIKLDYRSELLERRRPSPGSVLGLGTRNFGVWLIVLHVYRYSIYLELKSKVTELIREARLPNLSSWNLQRVYPLFTKSGRTRRPDVHKVRSRLGHATHPARDAFGLIFGARNLNHIKMHSCCIYKENAAASTALFDEHWYLRNETSSPACMYITQNRRRARFQPQRTQKINKEEGIHNWRKIRYQLVTNDPFHTCSKYKFRMNWKKTYPAPQIAMASY